MLRYGEEDESHKFQTEIDVATFSSQRLADVLQHTARGDAGATAAVHLLAAHGCWLQRSDFRDEAIRYWPQEDDLPEAAEMHWDTDPNVFPCSSSEHGILSIALSLGGPAHTVNLRDTLSGLDERNQQLVLNAVAAAMDR